MEISLLNLAEHLSGRVTLEWQVATDKSVKKHTERPDVSFLTIGTVENFRSHIVGCSRHSCQILVGLGSFGEAKVNQTHSVVLRNHNIIGLNITMNNVLSVTMIDSLEQGLHVVGGSLFIEGLVILLSDFLEELSSSNILHDQIDILLIVVGLVIFHDVGVVESVKDSYFLHDAVNVISEFDFVQDLDGNLEVLVMFVSGQEDTSKCTNTENFGL